MSNGIGLWSPTYGGTICWEIASQYVRDVLAAATMQQMTRMWNTRSSFVAVARNMAVRQAVENDLRYLMMQDSDIFCPDGEISPLQLMLETMRANNAAVVGAICGLRRIDLLQVTPNVRPFNRGQVYEADRVGTGMILIDLDFVRKMRESYQGPLFACTFHDEAQTHMDYGEDFFFCRVIGAHCGKIWIDGRIPTVHAYTDRSHLHYDGKAESSTADVKAGEVE